MLKLKLENINKTFDGKNFVVKNFNLEVNNEDFVVLVGPSGCGKTTVLNIIAGLENQTSGNVYIEDKLVNNVDPKNRDIAMVFQNYALYPMLTVYDNLSFSLKIRKMKKSVIEQKVNEVAELLGISDLLDKGKYDESANLFIDTYNKGSDIRSDTYLKRIINNKIGLNKFNEINKNKLIELLINENFLLSCSKNDLYKIYTQFIEKNEKIRLLEVLFRILENTKFNGIHIAIKSMIARIKKDKNDPDLLHKLNQIELIEL